MFVMLHVMIIIQYECRVPSVRMTLIPNFVVRYKEIQK